MNALDAARKEMEDITANLRIRKALASKVPRNADVAFEPGDKVRVYGETDRRYIGPFPIIFVDGKQVFVLQDDREV